MKSTSKLLIFRRVSLQFSFGASCVFLDSSDRYEHFIFLLRSALCGTTWRASFPTVRPARRCFRLSCVAETAFPEQYPGLASASLSSDVGRCGMRRKGWPDFLPDRDRIGCETVCSEPQDWTLCRTPGIATRHEKALRCGALRTTRDRAAGEAASVGPDSRRFLGHVVQERLLLMAGEELEKP